MENEWVIFNTTKNLNEIIHDQSKQSKQDIGVHHTIHMLIIYFGGMIYKVTKFTILSYKIQDKDFEDDQHYILLLLKYEHANNLLWRYFLHISHFKIKFK